MSNITKRKLEGKIPLPKKRRRITCEGMAKLPNEVLPGTLKMNLIEPIRKNRRIVGYTFNLANNPDIAGFSYLLFNDKHGWCMKKRQTSSRHQTLNLKAHEWIFMEDKHSQELIKQWKKEEKPLIEQRVELISDGEQIRLCPQSEEIVNIITKANFKIIVQDIRHQFEELDIELPEEEQHGERKRVHFSENLVEVNYYEKDLDIELPEEDNYSDPPIEEQRGEKKRVRFAENIEDVRYFEKDVILKSEHDRICRGYEMIIRKLEKEIERLKRTEENELDEEEHESDETEEENYDEEEENYDTEEEKDYEEEENDDNKEEDNGDVEDNEDKEDREEDEKDEEKEEVEKVHQPGRADDSSDFGAESPMALQPKEKPGSPKKDGPTSASSKNLGRATDSSESSASDDDDDDDDDESDDGSIIDLDEFERMDDMLLQFGI